LSEFVKARDKEVNLTQKVFVERAGLTQTAVRKIEPGKTRLNMVKFNQVLLMFDYILNPIKLALEERHGLFPDIL
jgi:predicted transcriptional regulator